MDRDLIISGFDIIKTEQCDLALVDKMWESLCKNRWENLWESFHKFVNWMFLHSFGWVDAWLVDYCGKISGWFCTWFYLCKSGGFAQFPHSLLLQLLNIL